MNVDLTSDSITSFGSGPIKIATAPAPPVALAGPGSYTARSAHTTTPYLPSQALLSIQLSVLKRALVPP